MNLKTSRLLLVTLLAIAFVGNTAGCKNAPSRTVGYNGRYVQEWYCPPEEVLFRADDQLWCAKQCASCPNGYCSRNRCHCFPGTRPDHAGKCGQICPNCENGWCSSASRCECKAGFTWTAGGCVPESGGVLSDFHISTGLGGPIPLQINMQTGSRSLIPEVTHSQHMRRRGFGFHHRHPKHKETWQNVHHNHGGSRRGMFYNSHHSHNSQRSFENFPVAFARNPLITIPQLPFESFPAASPRHPSSHIPQRPLEHYPESPSQLYPQGPLQTPSGDYPQQKPQRPLENDPESPSQSSAQSPPVASWGPGSRQSPQRPQTPSLVNSQGPNQAPSEDYPQQRPQRPLENYPESPSQPSGQSPPVVSWRPSSRQSPQRPRQDYPQPPAQRPESWDQNPLRPIPQSPPEQYPQTPSLVNSQSPNQSPQLNPEYPLQPMLPESPAQAYPTQTPSPPLRPQQKPEPPSHFPEQSSIDSEPTTLSPLRPQSSPRLYAQPSSAGRPDHPYLFEKVDPQLQSSGPTGGDQHQSCQTDYLWDPKTNACIPYESVEGLLVDVRTA